MFITNPCYSVVISIVAYTTALIGYGVVLAYIPFLAIPGSLTGLSWTQHSHNQLYLKENSLPYDDYMALFGGLPMS